MPLTPPRAPKKPQAITHHGITLEDPYAWLRAGNWQDVMRDPSVLAADIRAHLEAENAYTADVMSGTEALQEQLFQEMKARLKQDDATVPLRDGSYHYFSRFVPGGQYPQLRRTKEPGTDGDLLLDGNKEADGKSYWDLGGSSHSPDHKLLAYATDGKGSELYTIRFRDLGSGLDLPEELPDTRGHMAWSLDSGTLYYVRVDDHHRPLYVYAHTLGTPPATDQLIYAEQDESFFVSLERSQSRRFVMINVHDHQTTEFHLIDTAAAGALPRLVLARETGHEYGVEHHGDKLIITTNSDGAEDFRIVEAPLADPQRANWKEILPHKPGRLILETIVYKNHMVCLEREESLPRIAITDLTTGGVHNIAFAEEAYALGITAGYEYETTNLRFVYSSMTTPAETYDYDMAHRTRVLRKRQEVPSGHDPKDYVTRRIYAPAHDGETIPISILHHKNTPLDGSAPLFLYGYGSYGISIPASFSTQRLSLVDRGFVFAIAHIRGGKDKGYRWYKSGKRESKTNTFKDFIAAGEYLAQKSFTRRGNIVANGGSAGGMLMGAVANMAPDLFLGIIADVPFVDVLNTMLDKDLPLTPPEWPEWGNPIESADDFETIRSYSPYDNVEAKAYPHIFAYGGLTDPRVTYWEPAKWVARLREFNTSNNLVLLKVNMDAGHGGASGRFAQLKEIALDYAFALKVAGLNLSTTHE